MAVLRRWLRSVWTHGRSLVALLLFGPALALVKWQTSSLVADYSTPRVEQWLKEHGGVATFVNALRWCLARPFEMAVLAPLLYMAVLFTIALRAERSRGVTAPLSMPAPQVPEPEGEKLTVEQELDPLLPRRSDTPKQADLRSRMADLCRGIEHFYEERHRSIPYSQPNEDQWSVRRRINAYNEETAAMALQRFGSRAEAMEEELRRAGLENGELHLHIVQRHWQSVATWLPRLLR